MQAINCASISHDDDICNKKNTIACADDCDTQDIYDETQDETQDDTNQWDPSELDHPCTTDNTTFDNCHAPYGASHDAYFDWWEAADAIEITDDMLDAIEAQKQDKRNALIAQQKRDEQFRIEEEARAEREAEKEAARLVEQAWLDAQQAERREAKAKTAALAAEIEAIAAECKRQEEEALAKLIAQRNANLAAVEAAQKASGAKRFHDKEHAFNAIGKKQGVKKVAVAKVGRRKERAARPAPVITEATPKPERLTLADIEDTEQSEVERDDETYDMPIIVSAIEFIAKPIVQPIAQPAPIRSGGCLTFTLAKTEAKTGGAVKPAAKAVMPTRAPAPAAPVPASTEGFTEVKHAPRRASQKRIKTEMCRFASRCRKGEQCHYAHHISEITPQQCSYEQRNGRCSRVHWDGKKFINRKNSDPEARSIVCQCIHLKETQSMWVLRQSSPFVEVVAKPKVEQRATPKREEWPALVQVEGVKTAKPTAWAALVKKC